jgi:hypothetical protein
MFPADTGSAAVTRGVGADTAEPSHPEQSCDGPGSSLRGATPCRLALPPLPLVDSMGARQATSSSSPVARPGGQRAAPAPPLVLALQVGFS